MTFLSAPLYRGGSKTSEKDICETLAQLTSEFDELKLYFTHHYL